MHDFTRKAHVAHSEIIAPDGAPEWVFDRERLWNQVEGVEVRSNSQVAREIRLTLPRELSRDQQISMVREWIKTEYVSQGMVADFAIHSPPASDGGEQPHAHIMLTMRHLDAAGPNGFPSTRRVSGMTFCGRRAFKIARKGQHAGSAFVTSTGGLSGCGGLGGPRKSSPAAAGIDGRVDHRTLDAQRADAVARGTEAADRLNRPREPNLRPGEKQRGKTERAATVEDIRSLKAEVIDLAGERQRRRKSHSPDAISRRHDRARRVAEARSRTSTIDSGNQAVRDRYKLKLLQQRYAQEIDPHVARDLAWVRMREASGEVVVQIGRVARARQWRDPQRPGTTRDSSFAVMIAAARAHGWTEIQVGGGKDFQRRSAEALTRVGIRVLNADLQDVVERTKRQMAADAVASDRALVGAALDHARRRLDDAQRAAQETEWMGPDGRRRPFLMKHPQLHQPIPARMTDDEVRAHLQPGWPAASARVTALRGSLSERQSEFDRMGVEWFRAGGDPAEIAELRDHSRGERSLPLIAPDSCCNAKHGVWEPSRPGSNAASLRPGNGMRCLIPVEENARFSVTPDKWQSRRSPSDAKRPHRCSTPGLAETAGGRMAEQPIHQRVAGCRTPRPRRARAVTPSAKSLWGSGVSPDVRKPRWGLYKRALREISTLYGRYFDAGR